ncbi:MAG: Eco57I restriction-modification methylase domain-containing protein [Chloroflexota bacterium]
MGKYEDADDNKIDVLIVRLKKERSLERARTTQRNFVAWYLNGSRGGDLKDAALVAFTSPESQDWRFSLVRMDYNIAQSPSGRVKLEKELTPARRYSFLVGENESSHTAQVQLLPILQDDERKPLLSDFEKAFNIEVVTREFFTRYRDLFNDVKEALEDVLKQNPKAREDFEAKNVDPVNFAKKLLGQIVFLYFLQKKGWFGVGRDADWGTGPRDFLRRLFEKKIASYGNFFNDVLEPLFYEALAVERTDDFYSRFNCKIPFLNGGLFDPINNYDWVHTDVLLPNKLFSNNEKTKEGDTGTGILDVFDRYNFTVKEDEPLDKEVAVDPEMLGKVFENLLEVKDRKSKGTYYTPREIVHYICQESLINYLDTALNTGEVPLVTTPPSQGNLFGKLEPEQGTLKAPDYRAIVPHEDIEAFVRMGELAIEHDTRVESYGKETERYSYKLPESIRWNARLIDDRLADIRVCDPAIGSGAFPVGLMTEIVRARNTLTTYLRDKTGRTNYNFKRHAIQNCLYGVDIDPGAVEIAKLRLWLSLVVDEEDIKQIQPLPNLDYKVVCGNSLLGVERNMFNNELFQKLEELKPLYFDETNAKKKQDFRRQIDQTIKKLTNDNETFDFEVYFSEVFHEKGGFDVVIANPPYDVVSDGRLRELFNESIYGRANLYGLFIHKAIRDILRESGILSFINPKTLLADAYFVNLRKVVKTTGDFIQIMKIVDRHKVFDEVLQACIIIVYKKGAPKDNHQIVITEIGERRDIGNPLASLPVPKKHIYQSEQFDGCFFCSNKKESYSIWNKVLISAKPLSSLGFSFTTGKIQWDLFKGYLIEKPVRGAARLLWAENIQRYTLKDTTKRTGLEYLKNPPAEPSITSDTIITQRTTADEQEYRIIATIFSPETSGFNAFSENHTNYLEKKSDRLHLNYILACLNSRLYDFIFRHLSSNTQVSSGQLNSLPFRVLSETQQRPFVNLADKILAVKKDNPDANTTELEGQIDQMVYELYGLTTDEIAVVEGKK